ncbi:hypothetical protein BaRGS_00024912 [Batillaria attramentaria]|uniref:Uncharacterized protein n=1 Tax=Batillaria attramentaria TaxID=370345 RepID=A0ABD0K9K7_9CAEN
MPRRVTFKCLLFPPAGSYSFVFPTLDHFELTAEENTNISLPFSFDTSCSLPHIFSITVARNEKDSKETKLPIQKDVCNIRLINSKCHVSHLKNNCSCGSHEDMFRFTRTVTRADIGSWIWRTTSGIAEEREVVFNITCPPNFVGVKNTTISIYNGQDFVLPIRTHTAELESCTMKKRLSNLKIEMEIHVVVAAIAVTVITISVIRHKKGGRVNETARDTNHGQPAERREPMNMEIQEPLQHQPEPGTESSQSNQSVHSYFEIPDETPPSSPEPPRRCLRPALPDDYLHPSVSTDIAEGTDDAKNVAPLYENTELRSISHNTGGAAACKSSPQGC